MAVIPKRGRGRPKGSSSSATLSASEALKAAEAAIGTPPKAKPAPVAAKTKPAPVKPKADPVPAAIVVASTAADAAPEPTLGEPGAIADVAPVAAKPLLEPVISQPVISKKAAAPKPLPVTEGTKTMTDILETGKKFAEETKAKLETVYAGFNEKAKAGVEKSTKAVEEISDIAKGNVEALVESGKIAAKGLETLGQEAVDYGRKSFEKATASAKSFSSVKTPTEFFQLHSQFLSSSFDDFTKEAAKSSEAFIKLAGDIAAPMTARVTLVTDKVKSLAA